MRENKIIVQQDGWRIERINSWPAAACLHNQGWCTSKDKDEYDEYVNRGTLYIVLRPNDRPTRPWVQVWVHRNFDRAECMSPATVIYR